MRKSNSSRLIIDSNIWVSFLISDRERKLDLLLTTKSIKILFSIELIEELSKISNYPKLKKYFPPDSIEEMLTNLDSFIELVEVKCKVNICRDPKDNFLLSLAKDGHANYLITGDKDLLELKKLGKTEIITLTKYFEQTKLYR